MLLEVLLILAQVAGAAVLGALARRFDGGWPKPPAGSFLNRSRPKILVYVALGFFAMWPALPWWAALPVSGALAVYWLPGHKLTEWTRADWLRRYGPVGLYWWWANRPRPDEVADGVDREDWFIDGRNAIAELAAGATVYGGAAALAQLAAWLAAWS